jgi:hypothetical protein
MLKFFVGFVKFCKFKSHFKQMKRVLLAMILIPGLVSAQDADFWLSSSFKLSSEDPNKKELIDYYYSDGNKNVFARGPVEKSGEETVIMAAENMRESKRTIYVRTGEWTIYYDSAVSVISARGTYDQGERHGEWKVFDRFGHIKTEYVFWRDVIQKQTDFDGAGNSNVAVNRSLSAVVFLKYFTVFLVISLLPITLFRIGWNILVWNKIYGTRYIPGFQDWQKGGRSVNMAATFIFWWIGKQEDSNTVKEYKRIGNWISVLSVILIVMFMCGVNAYGSEG